MERMPRRKKKAVANTVPAIFLFMTRERIHKVRRITDRRIHVLEESGRSKWPK
jgi:hypothetical protein